MRNDLKQARIEKGLTQKQVADAVDKDQGAISRYENGQLDVDAAVAPRLAEVLGLPILTVLYGEQPKRHKAA
jgi:transcriptional regulator with XRE-family HTH domain